MSRQIAASGIALLSLMFTGVALGRPVMVDELWTHPEFSRFRLGRVAVLPAITYGDDQAARWLVPERWRASIQVPGYTWIPAGFCYEQLGPTVPGRIAAFRALSDAVRRDRQPDPKKARELARLLQADALLLLRVDRWEHQVGAREMTFVDITASLVDSAGTCVWRGVSRSRVQAAEPHRAEPAPEPNQGMRVEMDRAPGGPVSGPVSGSSGGGTGGSSPTAGSDHTKPRIVRDDEKRSYVVPIGPESEESSALFRAAVDSMFTVWARKFPGAPRAAPGR